MLMRVRVSVHVFQFTADHAVQSEYLPRGNPIAYVCTLLPNIGTELLGSKRFPGFSRASALRVHIFQCFGKTSVTTDVLSLALKLLLRRNGDVCVPDV